MKHPQLPSARAFRFEIVGESFYQDELDRIAGGKTEEGHNLKVEAELVPEPNNPKDRNAVAVRIQGATVGYLPRHRAEQFLDLYPNGGWCRAAIRGGWAGRRGEDGHYGVKLDLSLPAAEQRSSRQPEPSGCASSLLVAILIAGGSAVAGIFFL